MKASRIAVALFPILATITACTGAGDGTSSGSDTAASPIRIAVIPKGTTHEFWKSIHAGALRAADELAAQGTTVEVIWKGPIREDDREQQIQVVEGFLSQGVQGIVLAPLDDRALVRPVEEAGRVGIPVVIIDSDLETTDIVSFVATDNRKGGALAADRLGEVLNGTGKVLMLRYQEGSASTHDREEGFLEEMTATHPGIEVVSSDQYAGPTRETAKRAAENLLNRYGAEIDGVFTPNESSTIGMLLALQDIDRAGRLPFVGFDSGEMEVQAVRDGQLQGIVLQNPERMGYLGVLTIVKHLRGEPVDARIDTGVMIVTPDNIDSPEARQLLEPATDRGA
ncbi:MAG: substrate-binding domain-containing protein [Gemmatimonadota bacterium]|jgi:ribose transport system substrate-binding protein